MNKSPEIPYLLLDYQAKIFADDSDLVVIEKARRIGITYCLACKAVDRAVTNQLDTWYLSYSEDAGVEFIRDCAYWATVYQSSFKNVTLLEKFDSHTGQSDSIKVNSIQFANGRRIVALSSAPRSLRGKQGAVIIDEAAFVNDLEELIRAATALTIWGGKVTVLSTHDGVANPFNELVEAIKSGTKKGSIHSIDFDQALASGLFKRICLVTKQPWSPEIEWNWRQEIIKAHGVAADEELFCRPRRANAALFQRQSIEIVDHLPHDLIRTARTWDLAATAPTPGRDPDWTRGLRGSLSQSRVLYVTDLVSLQGRPSETKKLIKSTAQLDGPRVEIGIWTDPGSAGLYQTEDLIRELFGFQVTPERAAKSKVAYATPVASAALNGQIKLLKAPWNAELLAELDAFPSKHAHDDIVDCLSRLWLMFTTSSYSFDYLSDKTINTNKQDPWNTAQLSGFNENNTNRYGAF